MFRILDLGCGTGNWPARLGPRPPDAQIIGIDLSHSACVQAANRDKPGWTCVCARGEQLPLPDATFDLVISTVSLPYLHIPTALREIRRVLKPGGSLDASLHPLSFIFRDFKSRPPKTPQAVAYRIYVIANGLWFHLTGNVVRFPFSNRVECWQSARGITIALKRAGLADIRCVRLENGNLVVHSFRPIPVPERLILAEAEPLALPHPFET